MPMIAKMAKKRWMRRVKQGLDQEVHTPAPGQGLGLGLAQDVEIPSAHASCYPVCQCGPNCTCGPGN